MAGPWCKDVYASFDKYVEVEKLDGGASHCLLTVHWYTPASSFISCDS